MKRYEEKSILLLHTGSGLSTFKYVGNGEIRKGGFLGRDLKAKMEGYDEAVAEMDSYSKLSLASTLCYLPSAGLLYMSLKASGIGNNEEATNYWIGAAIPFLLSLLLENRAWKHLSKAVWLYNRDALSPDSE